MGNNTQQSESDGGTPSPERLGSQLLLEALERLCAAEDRFVVESGCELSDEVSEAVAHAKTVIANNRITGNKDKK